MFGTEKLLDAVFRAYNQGNDIGDFEGPRI
jgi:hypothetical protein